MPSRILDSYAAHKQPRLIALLSRNARVTSISPPNASWLNAVEGFFAALTKRRPKRGIFAGLVDLRPPSTDIVADQDTNPKPFRWKASLDEIIAAARGDQRLDPINGNVARCPPRLELDRSRRANIYVVSEHVLGIILALKLTEPREVCSVSCNSCSIGIFI